MDNHFNPGYMSSYAHGNQQQPNLGSFGNLSAQNQQQDSPSHPTLPPLQSQNGGYQFGNLSFSHPGSQSQSPAQPHTPASASMPGSNTSAFSHMSPTNPQPGSMLPPSSFNQPYPMSQGMPYPSSTASSMPPTPTSTGLPKIQPMPPGGLGGPMSAGGLPSLPSSGQLGQQTSFLQNEEAPTHVVGSQGRRGILPSAPGRPNAPTQGSAQSTKSMIPQKDADGKFPCPHCNKTYLHAKHLKRHLLRHTGDRPYMCHLCKDTFSRSDILKRHFQKCSIRRGNPTGANHLAHQRRNTNNGHRLSISQQDGPIGLAGFQEVAGNSYNGGMTTSPTVNGDVSGRTSRTNSIITPGNMSHRNSVAGLGILSSTPTNEQMTTGPFQQGMPAFAMPNATSAGPMQSNYAFNQPQMNGSVYNGQSQQMPFLGQQSSRFNNSHEHSPHMNGDGNGNQMDWNRMFNQGGQDGFIGSQPANASSQGMHNIKTETEPKTDYSLQNDVANESFLGSLYSHPGAFGSEYGDTDQGIFGFPNWSLDDPLQAKVDSLIHYCFPNGPDSAAGNPALELVRNCLSVDSIKHLAEHYTSYHGHWPLLHMPTFKLADANNALVLTILCIGAIYSPDLNVNQTRDMMEFVKATVMRNCSIYNRFINNQTAGLGAHSFEIDEMQALIMLQGIFMWHGQPHHRRDARDEFPTVIRLARAMGLFQAAPPGHYAFSILHSNQANLSPQINVNDWNWHSWLEQEKRNRVLYQLFLTDAAMGMYFNCTPQIDPLEIRLMLPSDDAAWDARDAQSCAGALGLLGPQDQTRNVNGTKRAKQPGMREAIRTLMDPTVYFQAGTTNAYSKFILIHALIVRIIACQKALTSPDGMFQGFSSTFQGSAPATPLSQNDWLEQRSGSGSLSATSSRNATPTDPFSPGPQNPAVQQERKRLGCALDRWKRAWDMDMDLQYPPGQTHLRRFGFSRDGVHFFYLGRSLLQSQRAADWTAPADVRFKQVLSLLKRIKAYVLGEKDTKGQDIGSVGDIDEQYGLDNLTLDMKLLFKPYNSMIDSPVAGVQTQSL